MKNRPQRIRAGSTIVPSVCTAVLFAAIVAACSTGGNDDRRWMPPHVPEVCAAALSARDAETVREYLLEIDTDLIARISTDLHDAYAGALFRGDREGARRALETWRFWSECCADITGGGHEPENFAHIAGLSFEAQLTTEFLYASVRDQSLPHDLSADERIRRYVVILDYFRGTGNRWYANVCKWRLYEQHAALGEEIQKMHYLRSAFRGFVELGQHHMACQAAGELGGIMFRAGYADSMVYYFETGAAIARSHGLPVQAARFCEFYARYYQRRGRLSLAHDLYNESLELCRTQRAGCGRIRFLVNAMMFHAELGCWDVVDRVLRRSRIVERDCRTRVEFAHPYENVCYPRLDLLEARLEMSRGHVGAANDLYAAYFAAVDTMHLDYSYRAEVPRAQYYWASGLFDNGRTGDAARIASAGLARPPRAGVETWEARLALLLARIEYRRGDDAAAAAGLERFDRLSAGHESELRRERIDRDVLFARIRFRTEGPDSAAVTLAETFRHLAAVAGDSDVGIQSYLWLDECRELRFLMHDLTRHDAAIGYAAELYWRDLHRRIGGGNPVARSARLDEIGRSAVLAQARIRRSDAIHCLYAVHGGEIWRWTVSPAGIRRDVLATTTARLLDLVKQTRAELSAPEAPEAPSIRPDLTARLRELGHLLLPREITAGGRGGPLYVTAGGFLSALPFEALDVAGSGGYAPLILERDVAYVRHVAVPPRSIAPGPGLIIVNSLPSSALRKRYPPQRELDEARTEGETIAAVTPGATLLVDRAADKRGIRSRWGGAAFLYFATHILRDPQAPYLALIPLSVPEGINAPDAGFLDFGDIRETDFRGCELVILSGCSSGMPYIEANKIAPTLSDAFLDAGAHAVIQTFWDVRDDAAKEFMTAFVRNGGGLAGDKIGSLNHTRREIIRGPDGIRHPALWASYSIKLGYLP